MTLPDLPRVQGLLPVQPVNAQGIILPVSDRDTQAFLEDVSDLDDTIQMWDRSSGIRGLLEATFQGMRHQHYGPGPHPGTGTSQDVHGGKHFDREISTYKDATFVTEFHKPTRNIFVDQADRFFDAPEGHQQFLIRQDARVQFGILESDIRGADLQASDLETMALQSGALRVSINETELNVQSLDVDTSTLHRIQDLMRAGRLPTNREVFWSSVGNFGDRLVLFSQPGETMYTDRFSGAEFLTFRRVRVLSDDDSGLIIRLHHYGPGPHPGTGTSQDVHGKKGQEDWPEWQGVFEEIAQIDRQHGYHDWPTEYYISPDDRPFRCADGHAEAEHWLVAEHYGGLDTEKYKTRSGGANRRAFLFDEGWIRVAVDGNVLNVQSRVVDVPTMRRLQRMYDNDKFGYFGVVHWEGGLLDENVERQYLHTSWPKFLDARSIAGSGMYMRVNVRANARRLMDVFFDFVAGRYRYLLSGRLVPVKRVELGNYRVVKAQQQILRDLTQALVDGEITTRQWYMRMRKELKDQYRAAWLASIGGRANYDRSQVSRFGWAVRPQYRWLDNFLMEIQSGKQPLNGFAVRRAGMYARAGQAIYQNNLLKVAEQSGKKEAKRNLGPTDAHCHDTSTRPGCVELAAKGWVPLPQVVMIGDAACYSHCLCSWDFR